MVRPDWLKALVPYFDDRKIGYVQAPQDHRDWRRRPLFKEMLNWEYAGFFDIGMCLRNEYDAIIQHGTMTMVRRDLHGGDGRLGDLVHHRGHRTRACA